MCLRERVCGFVCVTGEDIIGENGDIKIKTDVDKNFVSLIH